MSAQLQTMIMRCGITRSSPKLFLPEVAHIPIRVSGNIRWRTSRQQFGSTECSFLLFAARSKAPLYVLLVVRDDLLTRYKGMTERITKKAKIEVLLRSGKAPREIAEILKK